MIIDTHAHLDFPDFDPDRTEVLQRADQADVKTLITIGTRIDTSVNAVALAASHSPIWATVGIHPCEAPKAPPDYLEKIKVMASAPKVAAIGEIGLDYHHLPGKDLPPEESSSLNIPIIARQKAVFLEQLDLACSLGLNVVLHQRNAWEDTLSILRDYTGRLRGVFHCFGGSPEQAREVIALGHLVSFTGIVTFKNAALVQETVRQIPEESFMVETDCPYLAPVPHRGKRCEPAHTRLVAEKIATLRNSSLEKIAAVTTQTAQSFFRVR